MGQLQILLQHLDHSKLVQFSLQFNVASLLFQCLRLLRITEILGAGGAVTGVTATSSKRLCRLLQRLCIDAQVMEELRPNVTKLFCYPISNKTGYHIQIDSAAIISTICSASLSWSLIWLLHDNCVVAHMLTSLQSVYLGPTHQMNRDTETAGLWVVGTQCIVELVAASAAFSAVLVQDYNSAKGDEVLSSVIRNSGRQRVPTLLSLSMKLYFGCCKGPDVVDMPFPPLVASTLLALLNLNDFSISTLYTQSH
jgi:hypothetical protein